MSANPGQALIYHITDVENLPGILAEGGLRSDAVMAAKNPTVIGYGHIKERRLKQIRVACCGGRFVGEFVPFYFCPRSPMLFTTNRGTTSRPVGCQRTILHLVSRVSVGIGLGRAWAVSDGNAGALHTWFYSTLDAIKTLDWAAIRATDWRGKTHQKSAEFLVADFFPWTGFHAIGCHNSEVAKQVQDLVNSHHRRPAVSVEPAWYYWTMIKLTQGNLLAAPAEALVNTVNTVGIMGRGIALQFKQAYPAMFRDYERACRAGEVKLGEMHVFDLGGLAGGPRWVISFPTKGHWRTDSRIADIEAGLKDLVATIKRLRIRSIAIPPLGCGSGSLDWNEVRPRIEAALATVPEVEALVYAPGGAPEAAEMPIRTERPRMTMGQAAMIALMDRYLKGLLDPFISLLEIHKLLYFLQEAGQPLRLKFVAKEFGPYATNLRQVLIRMERHYTQGYGDGKDKPTQTLEILPGAVEEAEKFLAGDETIRARMNRVAELIEGFEDPYGLELLSSVHWVMRENPEANASPEPALAAVHRWNVRKRRTLKKEHIVAAWERLRGRDWSASFATE